MQELNQQYSEIMNMSLEDILYYVNYIIARKEEERFQMEKTKKKGRF